MLKITLLAVGSRGDVNPACALGSGLKMAGYQVCIATHNSFREFVNQSGLEFASIRGNYKQLLKSEAGLNTLEGRASLRLVSDDLLAQQLQDCWQACQGSYAIISFPLSLYGYHIAEALKIPFFVMSYIPIIATKDFPLLEFDNTKTGFLARFLNPLSYKIAQFLSWRNDCSVINTFRNNLNLPAIPYGGVSFRKDIPENLSEIPIIHYFSPSIIPRPQDWSNSVYITGHLLSQAHLEYQPDSKLKKFINQGEKPIYVGFGSMTVRKPQAITETIIQALKLNNQKAILLSGWADLGAVKLPENIFLLKEYVPFEWLFPQLKAVVHHGGSGTVALGLRSGIPQVIVPFFADQPAWGKRLQTLGVAPHPLPVKELTTEKLSKLINIAINDINMQKQAKKIAAHLHQEQGVEEAVEIIDKYLN